MIILIRRTGLILSGIIFALLAVLVFVHSVITLPTAGKYREIKSVVIDAGHGNFDGGAESPNGVLEKDLNLVIAKKLEIRLKQKGFQVIMTRADDNGIHDETLTDVGEKKKSDMYKRRDIMNESGADFFISIHMNKFTDSSCAGPQVFYSPNREESEILAQEIQKYLNTLSVEKREIKAAGKGIYLLKTAKIPAVLVECGFLSNPLDEAKLCTAQYQDRIVEAIILGIDEYDQKK